MARHTHSLRTTHDYFEAGYMLNGFCMRCGKARPVAIDRVVRSAADAQIPDLHVRCPECFSVLRLRAVVPEHGMEPWSGE